MTDWIGHAPKNHMTSLEQWEREWKETVPHVSEPLYVDTQLLFHKRFIWLHPHFMVRVDAHESILLPHLLLCNSRVFFVNFTAGRRLQLIPASEPHDHMPLTMDLVTNGMRHSPDPTRGRRDHEKIEEMLSDPVARLTFFKELETKIRNSSIVGLAATEATPDDAWENLVQIIQETGGPCLQTSATGAWHSTTSDRLFMRSESCGDSKTPRSHVWRNRCDDFLVGFDCRDAWRKSSTLSCSARPKPKHPRTRPPSPTRQPTKKTKLKTFNEKLETKIIKLKL